MRDNFVYCCSAQEFLPSNVTAERSSILHTNIVRALIARPEWGLQMLKSKQRTLLSCAISSVLGLGVAQQRSLRKRQGHRSSRK